MLHQGEKSNFKKLGSNCITTQDLEQGRRGREKQSLVQSEHRVLMPAAHSPYWDCCEHLFCLLVTLVENGHQIDLVHPKIFHSFKIKTYLKKKKT